MRNRQRWERSRRGKYDPRYTVENVTDPERVEQLYREADEEMTPLNGNAIVAGQLQHPTTKMHQVWFSLYGVDLRLISAHKSPEDARAIVERVRDFFQSDDITDVEQVQEFVDGICESGDAQPSPYPDAIALAIASAIRDAAQRSKKC